MEVLEELVFPPFVDDVVDHAGGQLHWDQFEEKAEDLPEEGVAWEDVGTVLIAGRKHIRVEVPHEHYHSPNKVAGDQGHDLERLIGDRLQVALILRVGVLLLPLKLVADVDTDIPLEADYDEQESAEACPSNKPAIVPEVEVVVGHCAAFA